MSQTRTVKFLALTAIAASLLACGGGGDNGAVGVSAGSPEGVYGGTFTGRSSNAFQMLVLENNEIWALYGTQMPSVFLVSGFVQATGTAAAGSYNSSAATDFPASGSPLNGAVTATYNSAAGTISGSVTAPGSSPLSFAGSPIAGSTYNYNTPAAVATISGSWSLQAITGESIAMNITSSGTFTASSALGCNFSGMATPRSSGKNVFNLSITFGSAPCALPGQSATGIAINYPVTGGKNQLLIAGLNASRTAGTAAFGTR